MLSKYLAAMMPLMVGLASCSAFAGPEPAGVTPSPRSPDQAVSSTPGGPVVSPETPPYAPHPGDDTLSRGQVFLDASKLLIAESYPPQVFLHLVGSLPTPCHQLRVAIAPPDWQNRIYVDVYSVVDPAEICVQVIQAFEQNVAMGSLPAGAYTVWVNGQQVGEFTV